MHCFSSINRPRVMFVLPRPCTLLIFVAAALILSFGTPAGYASQHRNSLEFNGVDAQFRLIFENIQRKQLGVALDEVDRLIARHPNFRLAHLVRGDLLLARSRPISALGNTGHIPRERLDELRAEALARLRAYNDHPPADRIPRYLLWFATAQKHAVIVDSGRSRVYVYRSNNLAQRTRKRQYWIVEDGHLKIAYEAQVRGARLALPESFPGRS